MASQILLSVSQPEHVVYWHDSQHCKQIIIPRNLILWGIWISSLKNKICSFTKAVKFAYYPRTNPILLPCKSLAYARVQDLNVRGSNFIMFVFRNRSLFNLKNGKEIFYAPFLKTRRNNILLFPFIPYNCWISRQFKGLLYLLWGSSTVFRKPILVGQIICLQ